jgi:hypothetical protein
MGLSPRVCVCVRWTVLKLPFDYTMIEFERRQRTVPDYPRRPPTSPSQPEPLSPSSPSPAQSHYAPLSALARDSAVQAPSHYSRGVFIVDPSLTREDKLAENRRSAQQYRALWEREHSDAVCVVQIPQHDTLHPAVLRGHRGVRAISSMKKFDVLGRYFGQVIPAEETLCDERCKTALAAEYSADLHTPVGEFVLVPSSTVLGAQFMNDYRMDIKQCLGGKHEQKRAEALLNCELVVVRIDHAYTLWSRALRDIQAGEYCFLDYGLDYWSRRSLPQSSMSL